MSVLGADAVKATHVVAGAMSGGGGNFRRNHATDATRGAKSG